MSRLPTMLEILRENHGYSAEPARHERLAVLLAILAGVIFLAIAL